jgi:Zn-dependent peptidase ImmA (M78 family)
MALHQVRNSAESLIDELGVLNPPVDVGDVARRLGLRILYEKLETDVSGLLITTKEGANIVVQGSDAKSRQRFTIAHEIGHHHLSHHFEGGKHVHIDTSISQRSSLSSTGLDIKEIEANQFAASLLMPTKLIRQQVESLKADPLLDNHITELAKKFGVSEQAMTIRLSRLGLLKV